MFRILRAVGNTAVWSLAVIGVVCGLFWAATELGYIKALIVVSGSMEPDIMTGDLVIDRPHPTADLEVGEVASIYTDVIDKTVTHRVVRLEQGDSGQVAVYLKGDANDSEDGGAYYPGDTVWQPQWQIAGGGRVLMALTQRKVVVPLAITLLSLLCLSLLPKDEEDDSAGDDDDAAGAGDDELWDAADREESVPELELTRN